MALPALAGVLGGVGSVGGLGSLAGVFAQVNAAVQPFTGEMRATINEFNRFTSNLRLVREGVGTLLSPFLAIGSAMKDLAVGAVSLSIKAVSALASVLKTVVVTTVSELANVWTNLTNRLRTVRDTITALGNNLSEFVSKANPAFVKLFTFAADDLTASIGRFLIPVLQYATAYTRAFADVIFAIGSPLARLIRTGLDPFTRIIPNLTNLLSPLTIVFTVFADLIAAIGRPFAALGTILVKIVAFPIEVFFTAMAKVLDLLIAPLTVTARLLGDLMDAIVNFVDRGIAAMRDLLGIPGISGGSVGASVRSAQLGSVESFQSKALTAAFGMGTASSPEERTATIADQIYNLLRAKLDKFPDELSKAFMQAVEFLLKNLPGREAVRKTVDEIAMAGASLGRGLAPAPGSLADYALLGPARRGVSDVLEVFSR